VRPENETLRAWVRLERGRLNLTRRRSQDRKENAMRMIRGKGFV
jgi:hypothetical protein